MSLLEKHEELEGLRQWGPEDLIHLHRELARATARILQLENDNEKKDKIIFQQGHALRHDRYLTTMLHKDEFLHVFEEKIEKNKDKYVGLFFIDINSFKKFNDNNGHGEGDVLLKYFEAKIGELFRRKDDELVAIEPHEVGDVEQGRMGGDEFALSVVVGDTIQDGQRSADAVGIMYDLYDRLKEVEADLIEQFQHLMPDGAQLGISIGSTLYDPSHPLDAGTLMKQADEAMYDEKLEASR